MGLNSQKNSRLRKEVVRETFVKEVEEMGEQSPVKVLCQAAKVPLSTYSR